MQVSLSKEILLHCCHSTTWADKLLQSMPFSSRKEILKKAEKIWFSLSERDWLEAFAAHPKIGDVNSLKKKFGSIKTAAAQEQMGVNSADEKTLEDLALFNHNYEKKFGFIFIVFATGKSAQEMLKILKTRIENSRKDELNNAAKEQCKIMRLRLEKKL